MVWWLVFGGIALLGLLMVIGYAVWLAHKASDVFAELRVVAGRLGQLADLLGQIGTETAAPAARRVAPSAGRPRPVRPGVRSEPEWKDLDGEWDGDDAADWDVDGDDPADALGGADGAYHPDDRPDEHREPTRRGGPRPVTGRVH